MLYTVTLADGTTLTDLEYSGNNFVSKTPINTTIFDNNLSSVTIEAIEGTENPDGFESICPLVGTHTDLILIQCREFTGIGWMFILAKPTKEQKVDAQLVDIVEVQTATEEDITDIQEALVDIYEQLIMPVEE